MSKSSRNERRYSDDYEYEDVRDMRKSKKTQRRENKRNARTLPCEQED